MIQTEKIKLSTAVHALGRVVVVVTSRIHAPNGTWTVPLFILCSLLRALDLKKGRRFSSSRKFEMSSLSDVVLG